MTAESIVDDKELGLVGLTEDERSLSVQFLSKGEEEEIRFDPRLEWKN